MAWRVAFRIGAAALLLAALSPAATCLRYPYLQNVRSDRATIRWTSLQEGLGVVEYSTDAGPSSSVRAQVREMTEEETGLRYTYYKYHAVLTGLAGGAEYSYRVLINGQNAASDDELRFRTRAFSPFSFLAFGDSGTGSGEQARLAQLMTQERPALVLHTGDIVYPSGSFEGYQSRYFDVYRNLMKRSPFFPAPGNHDYQADGAYSYLTVHDLPVESVPMADQKRYYSYDWGNVHFIALDSNASLSRAANGSGAMLSWLENDLRNNRMFWQVAYFHHPPYASGPNERDSLSALARSRIVPILEKYNVPLVMNGHEHSYQRSWPLLGGQIVEEGAAGTVYVTTGGGGVSVYPVFPRPFLAFGESAHHYVRTDVNGFQMTLRAIRIDGEEIDKFTIAPPPLISGNGAVNSASFTPALAPGGLVSVFGRQLAAGEIAAARAPLPTSISGVSVTLDGQRLPLFYVSPTQINAQLPFDVGGPATLRVTTPNGSSDVPVVLSEVAPALFSEASVAHADGTPVSAESPAQPSEFLSVFLTGLGRVNGAIAAGQAAPALQLLTVRAPVEARLGDVSITPAFAGLSPGFAGLYQVNLQVPPAMLPGTYPLRIVAGGTPSNAANVPVGAAQ